MSTGLKAPFMAPHLRIQTGRCAPGAREAGLTSPLLLHDEDGRQDHRWIKIQCPERALHAIPTVLKAPLRTSHPPDARPAPAKRARPATPTARTGRPTPTIGGSRLNVLK